jgi:hypothetical protein
MSTRPYDPEGRPRGGGLATDIQRIFGSSRFPELIRNDSIPRSKVKDLDPPVVTALPTTPVPVAGDLVYYQTASGTQVLYRYSGTEWLPVRGSMPLFSTGYSGGVIDGAYHELSISVFGTVWYRGFNPQLLRDGGFTKTRTLISLYFTSGGAANFNYSFGFNEIFVGTVAWGGVGTQAVFSGHGFFDSGWYDIPAYFLSSANYFLQPMYMLNLAGAVPTLNYQFISIEVR